ncbi:hypothetical protein FQA39_LY09470 [Lamprigera yunnana]|nr:hypothetical protein FQA39_LY09470 [Lamprigera yunnana]
MYKYVTYCSRKNICNNSKRFEKEQKWFAAAGRAMSEVSEKSTIYCCQDHFNLEDGMANYMEYKLSKVNVRMRQDSVPHLFTCQLKKRPCATRKKRVLNENISELMLEVENPLKIEKTDEFDTEELIISSEALTKRGELRINQKPDSTKYTRNKKRLEFMESSYQSNLTQKIPHDCNNPKMSIDDFQLILAVNIKLDLWCNNCIQFRNKTIKTRAWENVNFIFQNPKRIFESY